MVAKDPRIIEVLLKNNPDINIETALVILHLI